MLEFRKRDNQPYSKVVTCRHRGDGRTGPRGAACACVAPVRKFALEHGKSVDYCFFLAIGTLEDIRARLSKLRGNP